MKILCTVVILLLASALIRWIRQGEQFSIVQTLPLLGGFSPSFLWDGAGLAMLLITAWGWRRLGYW